MRPLKRAFGWLRFVLRIGIAAAIIWYIFRSQKIDPETVLEKMKSLDPFWGSMAFLSFGACLFLGIVRWGIILDVQGMRLRPGRLASIYFIGHFFNSFMFGSTGGDVVKAWYIAQETRKKKAAAVMSVLVDRVVGLYGLFCISLFVMITNLRFFLDHPITWGPAAFVVGILVVGTVLIVGLMQRDWFRRIGWMRSLYHRLPGRELIGRLYDAFEIYRHYPRHILVAVLLSIAVQMSIILEIVFLARGFDSPVSVREAMSLVPLIMCVSAIPITPGGWGVREHFAVSLFPTVGVEGNAAFGVSVLFGVITLAWSLIGGIPYVLHRSEIPVDADDPETDRSGGTASPPGPENA